MSSFRYTPEMVQFIIDHNQGTPQNELARLFNERFGTDRTGDNMKSFRNRHKLNSGLTGQFKKGQESWTKGKKWDEYMSREGQENSRKTCFKPGRKTHNVLPVGTELVDSDGYLKIKVTDRYSGRYRWKNWKHKQRLVWEEHNGPVPEGHNIIFLDGDRTNCDISNLACVSLAENAILNNKKFRIDEHPELTQAGVSVVKIQERIKRRNQKKRERKMMKNPKK